MIDKREILDAATGLGLTPHVVEKDYVLGWLLWGAANHEAIADTWTFKGGTRGHAPRPLAAYLGGGGEEVIRTRIISFPASVPVHARPTMQAHLDVIRFAASNRLCVDLLYQGSTRRIEPYSLRRTLADNVILHAHNRDKNAHRSYRLDRIQGARVTNESFIPRFAIELTPTGLRSPRPRSRSRGPTHV